jgi:hypothetical protein
MVGNDHLMLAQARVACIALVLEEIEQALLAHQPFGEGQVALLVLRGQAAQRIDAAVSNVEAPRRRELAAALPGAEDSVTCGLVDEVIPSIQFAEALT